MALPSVTVPKGLDFQSIAEGAELDRGQAVGRVPLHDLCKGVQTVIEIEDAQVIVLHERGARPSLARLGVAHEEEFGKVT